MVYQPTAVSQNVVIPTLQLVCPSNCVKDSLSWLQAEVVCIVQTQST